MRRSAAIAAPLLAAAALAMASRPARAQSPTPPSTSSSSPTLYDSLITLRNGFGSSFKEHPYFWLLATGWTAFVIRVGG